MDGGMTKEHLDKIRNYILSQQPAWEIRTEFYDHDLRALIGVRVGAIRHAISVYRDRNILPHTAYCQFLKIFDPHEATKWQDEYMEWAA